MDAQEELEKLERECRQNAVCAGQYGDRAEEDEFNRIASKIAAIRDGFGKAQGEPVRWMCPDHGDVSRVQRVGWIPLYREAPHAGSAQALVDAIATAYGYLWHVNNEPGTPNQYPPERAAYEARKILRGTMTHEQRGEAINRVRAIIVANEMEPTK